MATHKIPRERTLNRRPTPAAATVDCNLSSIHDKVDTRQDAPLLGFNLPCQELHRLITHIPKHIPKRWTCMQWTWRTKPLVSHYRWTWLSLRNNPGWSSSSRLQENHPSFGGIWGIFFIFKFINEKPKDTNMQPVGLGTNWTSTSFQGDFWASWVQILVFSQVRTVTCCDLPVSICSIDSSEIIRNVPEILSFNQLLLKLDWFICN